MQRRFGEQIADTLEQLADALEALGPEGWGAQSLCTRWTVRDVAGHIVWRVGTSYPQMLRSALPAIAMSHASLDSVTDTVARREAEAASPDELLRRMRRIAQLRAAGIGRTGLTDFTETLVHSYDIVQPLGVRIEVDSESSRRVALRGLLTAAPDRRVVVADHTLYAADAGWAIGARGGSRIIEGTAQGVILYLYGRHPLTPPPA